MKTIPSLIFILLFHIYANSQTIVDSMIQSKSKSLFKKEKKAPGVIIEEIPVQNHSITEVESAIPAFIGFTQIAIKSFENDLFQKPFKITSMLEYERYFGFPFEEKIAFSVSDNGSGAYKLDSFTPSDLKYILYYAVKHYFDNGGGVCYIVSAGTYQNNSQLIISKKNKGIIDFSALNTALASLENFDDPTLVVVPEAVKLSASDYQSLVRSELGQCGKLGDRFAILDMYDGSKPIGLLDLSLNREYFGNQDLKFGAVYYPFLKTNYNYFINKAKTNIEVVYNGTIYNLTTLKNSNPALYGFIMTQYKNQFVVLPPSSAVAGCYVTVDRTRGVWKAPANISVSGEPVSRVNDNYQEQLIIDVISGKSINVIRNFTGKGNLIWGARTLAGNDNEWRYVPVRRFFIMVEESVKKSTEWVVFEPNDANTWSRIRSMVEDYLTKKWREGALMGSKSQDAFFVRCGLGQTMTNQDILEGKLNIEIGMSTVRPAEFIILKISHKIQKP